MKLPIRLRLAFASCAVFLVIIAALEITAYLAVRTAIRSIVDHELETRLAGLEDHLDRHLKHMSWPELSASLQTHPAFQPELLRVESPGGRVFVDGSGVRGIAVSRITADRFETMEDAGRTIRLMTASRKLDGVDYRLSLGTNLYFSARILGKLWLLMLFSIPLVLLISGGAGYWISGRALQPVSAIISAARAVDSQHLGQRITVPDTGDEMQLLAETVNGMLARIEAGVQQIRQFTANASHELRTPLAIIRAHAEIALLDSSARAGHSTREALERILREAERDTALLEDLLHLARAGSIAEPGPGEYFDLRDSLGEAAAAIRVLAESNGITLKLQGRQGIQGFGYPDQLRRLWMILFENAVKFTPQGGRVTIAVAETAAGPSVAVTDSGPGIAMEHRARIFEPFYRVDQSRSRTQGGTGLGLAIAKQIATLHGASIEAGEAPAGGNRFVVSFPALPTRARSPKADLQVILRHL